MNRKQLIAKLEEAGMYVATTKVDGFNALTAHKDGRFTFRETYFYTGGKTEYDWQDKVVSALESVGVQLTAVTVYNERNSWPKDSFWAVCFEVVDDNRQKMCLMLEEAKLSSPALVEGNAVALDVNEDGTFTYTRFLYIATRGPSLSEWGERVARQLKAVGVEIDIHNVFSRPTTAPGYDYWCVSFKVVNWNAPVVTSLSMEEADEVIQASDYADRVEDHEQTDTGEHVYTLDDGSAVSVTRDGDDIVIKHSEAPKVNVGDYIDAWMPGSKRWGSKRVRKITHEGWIETQDGRQYDPKDYTNTWLLSQAPPKRRITASIPAQTYEKMERLMGEHGLTKAEFITMAIEEMARDSIFH